MDERKEPRTSDRPKRSHCPRAFQRSHRHNTVWSDGVHMMYRQTPAALEWEDVVFDRSEASRDHDVFVSSVPDYHLTGQRRALWSCRSEKGVIDQRAWAVRVSELVVLSLVSHEGLYQGWKQTSIHLLVTLRTCLLTTIFSPNILRR